MALLSSEVERLLSIAPADLPLSASELRPRADTCKLQARDAESLFPDALDRQAALAGLLLRLGCWSESHGIAQDISSAEGSYWHAIIHRMEPDPGNAGYWFRHTGKHPIFCDLRRRAGEILSAHGPAHWELRTDWDPILFVRWCDEARERKGQAEASALRIQAVEWELLFDWCTRTGPPGRCDEAAFFSEPKTP